MTWFWKDHRQDEIDPSNRYHQAHLLIRTDERETPAGNLGEVHVGRCGVEIEAWGMRGVPVSRTGTYEDVVSAGVPICTHCRA